LFAITCLHFLGYFSGDDIAWIEPFVPIASVYFVLGFFACPLLLVADILYFIPKLKGRKIMKFVALGLAAVLTVISFIMPRNIEWTNYDVNMPKESSEINGVTISFLSDLHIGTSIKKAEIDEIVQDLNKKNSDLIILGGDIFDEGTSKNLREYFSKKASELKAKYGVYFIIGNHDDYLKRKGLKEESNLHYISEAGIEILDDQYKLFEDKFILVGREDYTAPRESLEEILRTAPKDLPLIIVDHQPRTDEEVLALQLSGHTHNGQLFPMTVLDPFKSHNLYGYYERDGTQLIVSSGTGTYGIANRFLTKAEILLVNAHFE
jgi:predicted MPP superfamily phosphohydrolase